MNITEPLRLAVGSHEAGSGKGCAMNVISWENGDSTISDMPACVDPMLARVVQRVNDALCTHRDGDMLCPSCSVEVLRLAHRTVGTAAVVSGLEAQRVYVRIAVKCARHVSHLNDDPRVKAAVAAEAAAYAAYAARAADADAAEAAAYAARAAHADAAEAAADAAEAAAYAAAYAVGERLSIGHMVVDEFLRLTGHVERTPDPDVTAEAVERMLVAS